MTANDTQVGGDHYQHSDYQHWDWAWEAQLDSFQYPITKYIARHKRKNGFEDLEKASHYLDKYIELTDDNPMYRQVDTEGLVKIHKEWSESEDLDIGQHRITFLVSSWSSSTMLPMLVQQLKDYTEKIYGTQPGAGYVDQDRQDCTVQVTGVTGEGSGGL